MSVRLAEFEYHNNLEATDDCAYIEQCFVEARNILKNITEPSTEEGELTMAVEFDNLAKFCKRMRDLYRGY